jgi:nucleolar protein 12
VADADNADKAARTVFVGNLDAATKPKKLKQLFSPCGAVESVRLRSVAVDPEAKLPRRAAVLTGARNGAREAVNGYVVFASPASLPAALALNMRVVDGRHIRVDALRGGAAGAATAAAPGRLGGAAALLATQLDHRRSVYLGNLHYAIDDEEVIAAFSKGGSSRPLLVEGCVEAVRIPRDRETGRSKGFGYVLFRDGAAVSDALSLAGVNIHGRPVRVARASAKRAVLAATTKAAAADARAAVAGVPRTLERAAAAAEGEEEGGEGDAAAPAAAAGDDAPKMARWKVRALRAAAAGDAAAAAVLQGAAAAAAAGASGAAAGPRRRSPWEGVHATPAARPASAGAADGGAKAGKVRTKPRWRDLGRDVGTPLAQYASPLAMLKPPGAARPGGGGSAPAAKPKGRKAGAKLGVGKDGGTKRISGRKRPAVAARKSALARKKATGG